MKRNEFIKKSGPYEVHSSSQDGLGVRLVIYPAFPTYGPKWAVSRQKGEGGGPSIFTALALANEFEAFLNQSYTEADITAWKATLAEALKDVREKQKKRMEKAFARAEAKGAPAVGS